MSVSMVEKEGLSRELTIELPVERLNTLIDQRAQEVAGKAQMPGFRSDKPVPLRAVKQRYGKSIREEASRQLMVEAFLDAVKTENIEPAADPDFEVLVTGTGDHFRFRAAFEIIPTIELKLLEGVKLEKLAISVTADDLAQALDGILKQHRHWHDVERDAKQGDKVTIDFTGTVEGKTLESGNAENYDVELGTATMIPGFEAGVVGRKAGESFTLDLKFPEDYHHTEVAGKAVSFEVTLKAVKDGALPELGDEICKQYHYEGDVEGFKNHVQQNIAKQGEKSIDRINRDNALNKFLDLNPITAPESMITQEIARRMESSAEIASFNANESQKKAIGELMRGDVARAVKLGLLLRNLIQGRSIDANEEDVRAYVEDIAEGYETPDDYLKWFFEDMERVRGVHATIIENKAIDWLIEQADTEIKTVSFHELLEINRSKGPSLSETEKGKE
jgi:trigger factor